jgi:hypothetical protein
MMHTIKLLGLTAFLFVLPSCAKLFTVADIAADKAKCVVRYQDLPNEEIFARCALEPGDIERYLDLITESRLAAQRAAAKAAGESLADGGSECAR